MEYNKNRLQFVHHDETFATREEAIAYVTQIDLELGDKYGRPALFAEPMVLKYGDEKEPNIILAIGSIGDGEAKDLANRTFFIDFAKHEAEIQDILEKVASIDETKETISKMIEGCGLAEDGTYQPSSVEMISSATSISNAVEILAQYVLDQTLSTKDTNSVKLTLNKLAHGIELSADAKLAEHLVVNRTELDNIIIETPNGLFANVDLGYEDDTLNLLINGEVATSFDLPKELHVVKGEYVADDETIKLTMNDDSVISIEVGLLIAEWDVTVENKTPIVLTKTKVKSEKDAHGVATNQDTLSADVTLHVGDNNILVKSDNGTSLYVNGSASNIKSTNGNVQEDLDNAYENYAQFREEYKDYTAATEEYHQQHIEVSAATLSQLIKNNATEINTIKGDLTVTNAKVTKLAHDTELSVTALQTKDAEQDEKISANTDAIQTETTRAQEAEGVIADNLAAEITRAKAEEQALKDAVHAEQDRAEKAEQKVNVLYDSAKNQITFVNSEGVSSEIQLNAGSIVDDIHYEPTTEEIIITYTDTNKVQHVTKVPVSALIREWEVNNANTTVTLTKVIDTSVGKDLLSAKVNVATNVKNNILEEDGSHSSLFVRGEADNIAYDDDATVKDKIDTLTETLNNALTLIDTLQQTVNTLQQTVNTLTEKVDNLEQTIQGYDAEIARLDKKSTLYDATDADEGTFDFTINADETSEKYGQTSVKFLLNNVDLELGTDSELG